MTLSTGTRLGSYEVLSSIGAGGMGEVYRARDARLGRDVAIKVLPERLLSDPDSRLRFEHEARAVAALSHPNILSIFDVGQEGEVFFAVMELLEGETLRGKLSGPLPARRVADYAAQIAGGLAAAHGRGVVHRDLKPENLFVSRDGHVKILDFGLARRILTSERPLDAAGREQTAAEQHPMAGKNLTAIPTVAAQTEPGSLMGTAAYMSPEQARGWPADHRSDIFSFGVVLYEMLAGERPFRGETFAEVLTAILRDDPPELPESARDASPALERIARRCLEKDPDNRFQLARDLAFALEAVGEGPPARRPAALALQGEAAADGKRSVAVLFFKDLARDPENAHLGLGLADATITELATVRSLLVRPTSAILRYQDRSVPPEQAGRELGVDAVVDGSFQRAGSRLRVTVQLVASSDGRSLWGTKIDTTLEDVFRMQDEVSRRIAEALKVELSPADERRLARVAQAYGRSWEDSFQRLDALLSEIPAARAHELYMKGRVHLFSERIEDVNAAIESFEKARDEDPGFALAWVGLSSAYTRMGFTYDPEGNWLERAEAMCERALAIDPKLPEGRFLKGQLAWTPRRGFDHAEAIREFTAAIAGRPSLTEAHERLGIVLLHVAMLDEAAVHIGEARQINPEDTLAQVHLGLCRLLEGRYAEALEISLAVQFGKDSFWNSYQVALCQLRIGDLDAAEQSIERGSRRFPGDPLVCSVRAMVSARRGNAAAAREQIALTLRNRRSFGHFHHAQYDVACALALLGDKGPALEWLAGAAGNGFPCHAFFERDPFLESLRDEPRFSALMKQLRAECDGYRRLYEELSATRGGDSSG